MRFTRPLLIAILLTSIAVPLVSPSMSVHADCTADISNGFHADNPSGQTCPDMSGPDDTSSTLTNEGTVDNGVDSSIHVGNNTAGGAITNVIDNNGLVTGGANSEFFGGTSNSATGGDVTNFFTNNGTLFASRASGADAYIIGGDLASPSGNMTNILTNTAVIEGESSNGSAEAYIIGGGQSNSATGTLINTITNSNSLIAHGGLSDSYAGLYGGVASGTGKASQTIKNTGSFLVTSTGGNAYAEMFTDIVTGSVNATNTLINDGTMTAQGFISGTALFDGGENISATANVNNLFINNGLMDANGGTATVSIVPNEGNTNVGSITSSLINTGTMKAGLAGGSSDSETFIAGADNHGATADVSNTLVNSGTMISVGTTANTYLKGGDNDSTSGNVTNTFTVSGTIIANGITDHDSLTPVNPADLGDYPGILGGNNNSTSGNVSNAITVSGAVFGNVVGGTNSGSGTTTNTTTLTGFSPTVAGTIYGDGETVGQGGALDQLLFEMSTTNEGLWDQWNAQIAAFGGSIPTTGSIVWGGTTYYWNDLDELQNLVHFLLIVTWFNPGDNRVDPKAGDHIAAYCNIKDGTIGVYVINGDSVGQGLTSFTIGDLRKAGSAGVYHNLGAEGIVSLMVDGQNNFWLAWNGGPLNANGQGDFAKGFSCAFP